MKILGTRGARRTNETGPGIHANLQPLLPRQKTWKVGLLLGAFLGALAILLFISPHARAQEADPCAAPANEVVAENCKQGDPASEWDVQGSGDPSIQGFATDMSVDQGETVQFKVKTDATDYRLDIYRMGYYDGDGAREVATVQPSATLPQDQPNCLNEQSTGLIDCGNWDISASWDVPNDAVSGVYFAKLVGPSGASHIVFVVRDDDGESNMLFQTADTTWQAYNSYGGNSLYTGSPAGRAYKVSYNRPFNTRAGSNEDWLFNSEYPMIRWLERNGYDVSYFTGIDSDRYGDEILDHKTFLSVGHDEYWSGDQRENVEAARDAGVNLAFFSGNEVFWKTRWEGSIDGSGASHRTLVSYKETRANAKIDPSPEWTGTWRDNRIFNPEGPQPENALTGTIFTVNCCSYPMKVPAADGKMRLWRNTSVADLAPGDTATFPEGTVGYEWDEDLDNGFRPEGLIRLSSTTVDVPERIQDQGSSYGPGTATHALTLYRDANGADPDALVFGAGTVQWSWGLDSNHDRGGAASDGRMQQATVNLFADMGVQPATLQSGLTAAASSTDSTAPTSTVTSPESGATVQGGSRTTVTGTAVDTGGGTVGGVEVSVDGGNSWHRAEGRASWSYSWTPGSEGPETIKSRAADDSGNLESPGAGVDLTVGSRECPCTIFNDSDTPSNANANDTGAVELGTKFRADTDGSITGLRFYKGSQNTGTHVGHLWKADGTQLAEATFTGETTSGWQQVTLSNPVQITADTTYIASYHAPQGRYAFDPGYFNSGLDNAPLRALANGVDGPNGVYKYGPSGGFPNDTFNSSNYWVDVVFEPNAGADETPPTVSTVSPTGSGAGTGTNVTATFSEAMDQTSVSPDSFGLRDAQNNLVSATVTYNGATRTATLDPTDNLANSTTYTATVKGGTDGVKDTAGNALAQNRNWTFTTVAPPPPPPDEGPGGPILVITDSSDSFGRFYAEILRNEGLNEFTAKDISSVSAATLADYDVAILAEMPLSASQAGMLGDWVNGGGNLVAMRPDSDLAGLLGLSGASGTLGDAYMKVDTSSAPGEGIVGQSMQFHGTADRYALSGADAVATLYSDASTATSNPAVTMRDVGNNGGQAAAFTYDLARSVVYTRQGNPAWSGDERDGQSGPIRSNDLFYGDKAGDSKPDWVDLSKVEIPQADEQQRLLANLIGEMNLDKQPLPRFWYFPRGEKAVVVMTGDDHGTGGTAGQFDNFKAASPQGCSVADWECIRGTSYIYTNTSLSDAQARAYQDEGFEVALHVDTGCNNWTSTSLRSNYADQLAAWRAKYASLDAPVTNRTHCIAWSDWATQPEVELENGIRLDTNYYYWPGSWVQNRPGMFTGSGMPMRFADLDGGMIDVYQATTQMTDESGQTFPSTINALLDKATGPEGYYGAFTANMHTDQANSDGANAIVASARARDVPVVSARQMLEWLDGRNASSFENMSWNADKLNFTVDVGAGARGLQAMVPADSEDGKLTSLKRGGSTVDFTKKTIKGVEYATFSATAGSYEAAYEADTTAPAISGLTATPDADGTATITWTTDEPSTSRVDYGTSAGTLDQSATEPGLTTSHSVRLTGLEANITYHYRVTSADDDDNAATSPQSADAPANFETPNAGLTDTTTNDFSAGTPGSGTHVAQTNDGEVTLKPTVGEEFSGSSLPNGWSSSPWTGGTSTVSGGNLVVDGARANTDALYGPGRSLEFVATFGAQQFQHVGFGVDLDQSANWAMFSTSSTTNTLYARTNNNGTSSNTSIPGDWIGSQHRYRIEWAPTEVRFYVDGNLVHTENVSIGAQMRPLASDYNAGGPVVAIDWLRMDPYQSPGAFESRVFDSTKDATDWGKLTSTVQKPAGTNVTFETRSGNTATPDGTWSGWQAVNAGDAIASPDNRYIQYRANLSTSDASVTPSVEQVTLSYSLDKTPPAAPSKPDLAAGSDSGSSDADDVTNVATPTLEGTAEPNSSVELFTDGNSLGTADADANGAWSFTPAEALDDGTYQVTAKVTDAAGNESPASATLSVTVDTVAPSASLTAPDDGARVRGTVTLSADTNDNSGVERVEFLVDGNVVGSDASEPYSFAWNSTGVSEGNKAISARAYDLAGNTTTSDARTVIVDNTAPEAPSSPDLTTDSGSDNTDNLTNDATPTFTGTAENGATIKILVDGAEKGNTTATDGTYSITTSALDDGPHAVTARATDTNGNEGTESEALDVTVDTQKPGAPTRVDLIAASDTGASSTDNTTSDDTPTFDLTAEADSNVRVYKGSDTTPLGSARADGTGIARITSDQLADGTYTISATSEDAAGNVSDSSTTINVTIEATVDTQAPAAPSRPDLAAASDSGSSSTDDVTRNTTPTFNGTAEANSSVELFTDGNSIGTTDAGANGAWSFTPATALADGTYSVTAKAKDGAGNTSQASTGLSLKVDTAAPSTVLQLEATPSQTGIALEWTDGSDPDPAGYNVYRSTSPTGTFNKLNNGLLAQSQYNDTQAPAGVDSYYRVTAVDQAGNESDPATGSARRPALSETVRPTVALGATPAAGARVGGTVTLSADASDNTGVERVEFLGGGNVVGSDTSAPYSFAWDTTGVPDGSTTIAARAFDVFGNQRTTGARTVVVDNTAPTAPPKPNLASTSDSGASDTDDVTRTAGLALNNGTSTVEPRARIDLFEGTSLKGTVRASVDGTWSIKLSDVTPGVHDYKVKLTDVAGNSSPPSEELSVTVDRQVPTITDLTPAPGSTTSVRSPAIRAMVDDDQAGELAKSGIGLFVDSVAIGQNAFSYDASSGSLLYEPPSNLSIARHTVRVVVTDKAGNQKSQSWTFRVVT